MPLQPKFFFIGMVVGFVLCSGLGFVASLYSRFDNFQRFFAPLQPQSLYYPTISQLRNTVIGSVPPDRILVLVGSSSILRGLGQNQTELWTNELQDLLGDRFAVVNLAIDRANFTSFGLVAFRSLQKEFPRSIFVGHTGPYDPGSFQGDNEFRYLFWQAYYQDLISLDEREKALAAGIQKRDLTSGSEIGVHIGAVLDAAFYFRDLWQFIGYNYAFTLWSATTASRSFAPRRTFTDDRVDYASIKTMFRNDTEYARGYARRVAENLRSLAGVPIGPEVEERFRDVLPLDLRRKSVVVLMHPNPYYLDIVGGDFRSVYASFYDAAERAINRADYHVVQMGRHFEPDDYLDSGHLVESGARKMAAILKPVIEAVAQGNDYISRPNPSPP